MFTIYDNLMIKLMRGNYAHIPLPVTLDATYDTASICVGISEPNQPWGEVKVLKSYTEADVVDNVLTLEILPSDTRCLDACKYYYEVKVQYTADIIQTVIPKTEIYILS